MTKIMDKWNALKRITTPELIIDKLFRPLLKLDSFQIFVNRNVSIKCTYKLVPSYESANFDGIFEYHFDDIQKTDIILDIGASIGGFPLFISKFTKQIYAVEPLWTDLLQKNVQLNNIKNITVIDRALGSGTINIHYNKKRTMIGSSLKEIIDLCGGHIDFLKCDCEGGEWTIKPEELKGIRRIEMELHDIDKHNSSAFLDMLSKAGFIYESTYSYGNRMHIHARRLSKN